MRPIHSLFVFEPSVFEGQEIQLVYVQDAVNVLNAHRFKISFRTFVDTALKYELLYSVSKATNEAIKANQETRLAVKSYESKASLSTIYAVLAAATWARVPPYTTFWHAARENFGPAFMEVVGGHEPEIVISGGFDATFTRSFLVSLTTHHFYSQRAKAQRMFFVPYNDKKVCTMREVAALFLTKRRGNDTGFVQTLVESAARLDWASEEPEAAYSLTLAEKLETPKAPVEATVEEVVEEVDKVPLPADPNSTTKGISPADHAVKTFADEANEFDAPPADQLKDSTLP